MRGLKHQETIQNRTVRMSHLLQMRGLKLVDGEEETGSEWSHLLQMRGLKLITFKRSEVSMPVASFTDAWIETWASHPQSCCNRSRIFYRCVD